VVGLTDDSDWSRRGAWMLGKGSQAGIPWSWWRRAVTQPTCVPSWVRGGRERECERGLVELGWGVRGSSIGSNMQVACDGESE
jgi:hypothetical protein